MPDCLFCKIVSGDIPGDIVHTDDEVLAFRDIDPKAPVHVLVIPKAHYATGAELVAAAPGLAARWLGVAAEVADALAISETGYRLVMNTGRQGGQTVDHAHLHLLGGRGMGWPPG